MILVTIWVSSRCSDTTLFFHPTRLSQVGWKSLHYRLNRPAELEAFVDGIHRQARRDTITDPMKVFHLSF